MFQRHLMDYNASRSTVVGISLAGGFDLEPRADPLPNGIMADLKGFEREERVFNSNRKHRMEKSETLPKSQPILKQYTKQSSILIKILRPIVMFKLLKTMKNSETI